MDLDDLWDVADTITGSVMKAAAKAAREMTTTRRKYYSSNLGVLAARLCDIHLSLKSLQPRQHSAISPQLEHFLTRLEEIFAQSGAITVSQSNTSSDLSAIRVFTQRSNALKASLITFACDGGPFVKSMYSLLDDFLIKLRSVQSNPIATYPQPAVEPPIPPREYPANVDRSIYDMLRNHSVHPCVVPDHACCRVQDPISFWARLRLMHKVRYNQEDVVFDTLFSCISVGETRLGPQWQQLRFQVPWNEGRQVRVQIDTEDYHYRVVEHFCDLLQEPRGPAWIRLRVVNGQLHELHNPDIVDRPVVHAPSIPLSELLEMPTFTTSGRIVLAYVIARSAWQYYDSDFMKTKWTTGSIHFMQEYHYEATAEREQMIDTSSPYFAFNILNTDGNEVAEYCSEFGVHHRYPRFLALGVMLVELFRKRPESRSRSSDNSDISRNVVRQINSEFFEYLMIAKRDGWPELPLLSEEATGLCRTATLNCLDPTGFYTNPGSESRTSQLSMEEQRDLLYKRVVYPLEQLCADAGINAQPVDHVVYYPPTTDVDAPSNALPLEATMSSLPQLSEHWLRKATEPASLNLVSRYWSSPQVPRVVIAILDTGYDPNTIFFSSTSRSLRLLGWEDFAGKEKSAVDTDGHGTHVVSLVMKIAPTADIYVARVATDSQGLRSASSSSKSIAEAITWAAETAKADIISMSFGFSDEVEVNEVPVISDLISKALTHRHQRILFFAAAANDGGNQMEMFPATHSAVFSIRATDHLGSFLSLNPPPKYSGPGVFGTLGQAVASAGLQIHGPGEVTKDGTSTATPIAAGIAAMILGYIKQRLEEPNALERISMKKLWTTNGMHRVFLKLSTEMGQKIFYLNPARFSQKTDAERDTILQSAADEARHNV